MKASYLCPHCKGHLLLNEYLIFSVESEDNERLLLLINPEVGNYQSVHHPSYKLKDGQRFKFFCSICHSELHSDLNENLAMVHMTDSQNKVFELHFSRIAGQKSTYQIMGKEVKTFGIDAPHYLDFINLIDMS